MTVGRRIGILGGTFDPVHCGHLDLGAAAQHVLGLSKILVLPSHLPPHRPQPLASGYHRFAMVALAIAGRPEWRAIDSELRQIARSYTSDTLKQLHADGYGASDLFFITGADAFVEITAWKDYPMLLDLAHFAVVSRPGFPVAELPRRLPDLVGRMSVVSRKPTVASPQSTVSGPQSPVPSVQSEGPLIFLIDAATADVSSTAIRQALARGQSIAGLVPPTVQQHIEQHALYVVPASGAVRSSTPIGRPAGRLHGQG
jgi:nicotinate-nucleotide adenylyltransferase